MRHDMGTKFYKEDIAYTARRIMKLLANAHDGSEWDFEMGNDYGTKWFRVYNTTTIEEISVGGNGTKIHSAWAPTCYSYKMKARTWYELAENVDMMLRFAIEGARAANNFKEISDLD